MEGTSYVAQAVFHSHRVRETPISSDVDILASGVPETCMIPAAKAIFELCLYSACKNEPLLSWVTDASLDLASDLYTTQPLTEAERQEKGNPRYAPCSQYRKEFDMGSDT
jgi:hypothetical protein